MGLSQHVHGHISIHAPVKGATVRASQSAVLSFISIHAPVKGATADPTTIATTAAISIHAPVKGATDGHRYRYRQT